MTTADREYAAQQLLTFLGQVGPLEAIWAMTTALEELQEKAAIRDHVAAVKRAFSEAKAEVSEMTEVATAPQAPKAPTTPSVASSRSRTKKKPAAEGEQP